MRSVQNRGRSRLATALLVAGLALLQTAPSPAAAPSRPFAPDSPFNLPIPAAPRLDANSTAMAARASRDSQAYANLYAYGIPIVTAGATTPRYHVRCRMDPAWGPCPLSREPQPIPDGARPSSGTDGALVVLQPAAGTASEYWRAVRTGSTWSASWGAVNSLSGSGWGGGSTGAGASRLAGVVRVSEIKAGVINHALVLQSDNVCASVVRAPALKTDGDSNRSDCIPAGARLQLDPAVDLTRLSGLTPGERAVARALQVYGAYLIDRGGASLSVSFELAPDASAGSPGSTYVRSGFGWDYYGMPHIPWHRLRVLRTWNG